MAVVLPLAAAAHLHTVTRHTAPPTIVVADLLPGSRRVYPLCFTLHPINQPDSFHTSYHWPAYFTVSFHSKLDRSPTLVATQTCAHTHTHAHRSDTQPTATSFQGSAPRLSCFWRRRRRRPSLVRSLFFHRASLCASDTGSLRGRKSIALLLLLLLPSTFAHSLSLLILSLAHS